MQKGVGVRARVESAQSDMEIFEAVERCGRGEVKMWDKSRQWWARQVRRTDEVTVRVLEQLIDDRVDHVINFTKEILVHRHLPARVIMRVCKVKVVVN